MGRLTNRGIRKVCSCSRQKWSKCRHPWHFNYKPKGGPAYRFSLDKHLGKHIDLKGDAEAEADRIRTAIRENRFQFGAPELTDRDRLTVSSLTDTYVDKHLAIRRPRSVDAERNRLALACGTVIERADSSRVALGALTVKEITARDLEAFVEARLALKQRKHCRCDDWAVCSHPWRESKAGGQVAVNRMLARLRAAFNWAIRREVVDRTPFQVHGITAVSLLGETPRFRRLTPGEDERLLAACSPHLRALVEAALETCCRVSELLTMQWSQVRFDLGEIHLTARKTKAGRDRVLPMSNRLRAILDLRKLGPDGEELPAQTYVFGTITGEQIASVKTAWRLTCERAKIEGLHFHDLRREAACRLLESGRFFLHDVQRFLDHADITTTSRYLQSSRLALHSAMRQYETDRATPSSTETSENGTAIPASAETGDAPRTTVTH